MHDLERRAGLLGRSASRRRRRWLRERPPSGRSGHSSLSVVPLAAARYDGARMRISGVVREVVSPVSRWRADVDGRKEHGTQDGTFVIDHEGADLRVTARGDVLRGEDRRERIAWSEVASRYNRPLGQTAPFTEVKLTILDLAVG